MKNANHDSAKTFDVALIEKPGESGLSASEAAHLFESLSDSEAYPVEFFAEEHESSAMGFAAASAMSKIDYDYDGSGLSAFVAGILDDAEKETEDGEYSFRGLSIRIER